VSERRWDLIAGVAAILYGVLTLMGWFFWGTSAGSSISGFFGDGGIPQLNAPASEVKAWYTNHRAENWTGFLFFTLAILPYMFFLGRLRAILARAEGRSGTATSIYSIGSTIGVVVPLLYVTFFWMAAYRPDEVSAELVQYSQDIVMQTGPVGCLGWVTMFAGIAIVVLTSGGLPRFLGILAIPVGLCQFLYIGQGFAKDGLFSGIKGILGAFVPYGTYLAWIIVAGVTLVKRSRGDDPSYADEAVVGDGLPAAGRQLTD
jgi:hypothetical protein